MGLSSRNWTPLASRGSSCFRPQVLAAQESFRRHDRGSGVRAISVTRTIVGGDRVEELGDLLECRTGNFQSGHHRLLQSHDVPAGDGRVAVLARSVAPTAFRRLDLHRVVDGPLSCLFEVFVLRHAIELADRNRRLSLSVQHLVMDPFMVEESVLVLRLDQPGPALRHSLSPEIDYLVSRRQQRDG